jgi:glucose/arabinose dehydrogenase
VASAEVPAAFAVSQGGGLYVGELQTGRILRDGQQVADLAVSTGGESGLQSMAATGEALYAYASIPEGDPADPSADGGPAGSSKVLRFPLDDGGGLGEPTTILSVPGVGTNNAGAVAVGPDGLVYVDIGDNIRRGASQDLSSPFGKILRITPEGEPAPGNPFVDRGDADPRVWASGIRNTFAYDWLADGRMVGADNGPARGDEVNLMRAGGNYGWPPDAAPSDAVEPVLTWPETFAPSGLTRIPDGLGSWSEGAKVFVCGIVPGRMDLVDLDRPEQGPQPVLDGCALHAAEGPDGGVLFSNRQAVWRLAPRE